MKKFTSIACGVALSMSAVAAFAAPATLTGTSQTNLDLTGSDLGHGDYTGSGDWTAAGGTFTYSAHLTSQADATIDATLTGTMTLTAAGIFTDEVTGCTGSVQVCGAAPVGPKVVDLNTAQGGHYDFSNLAALTWGYSETNPVAALGGLPATTVYSYQASVVPVPAAAWLFGSALLGLAGVGRQRKAA